MAELNETLAHNFNCKAHQQKKRAKYKSFSFMLNYTHLLSYAPL